MLNKTDAKPTQVLNEHLLNVFNGVLEDPTCAGNMTLHKDQNTGLLIPKSALYAKQTILKWFRKIHRTSGQLNATLFSNWEYVESTPDLLLQLQTVLHYMSTYGSNFTASPYFPRQADGDISESIGVLNDNGITVEQLRAVKDYYIFVFTEDEVRERLTSLLSKNIGFKPEVVQSIVKIYSILHITKEEYNKIVNREVRCILSKEFGVLPNDPIEFLRTLVYFATEQSLLIGSDDVLSKIQRSGINVSRHLKRFYKENPNGQVILARNFNRFKKYWLAFKHADVRNRRYVNILSRLSKKVHMPYKFPPLLEVSSRRVPIQDIRRALLTADAFTKIKLVNVLRKYRLEMKLYRNGMLHKIYEHYSIRNGKVYVNPVDMSSREKLMSYYQEVEDIVYDSLIESLKGNISGKRVRLSTQLDYAVPTTAKQFIGPFPYGTRLMLPDSNVSKIIGIYWDKESNAQDLDLSTFTSQGTKIGWNGDTKLTDCGLSYVYSGDVTTVGENGSSEYIKLEVTDEGSWKTSNVAMVFHTNLYSKAPESSDDEYYYDVIFGIADGESNSTYARMLNPENRLFTRRVHFNQRSSIFGLYTNVIIDSELNVKIGSGQDAFYFGAFTGGDARVSSNETSSMFARAFQLHYLSQLRLQDVLKDVGVVFVNSDENCDIDLHEDVVDIDTFLDLFI